MTQQRLYELSCREARHLLAALDGGSLRQAQHNLSRIQHYVSLAETAPAGSLNGPALHRREQLELLGGIAENLNRTLDGMRREIAAALPGLGDRKSTRLNSSHIQKSRMPSSA